MAYPVIEDITETTPQSQSTHVIDYPATVDAGDLLIVVFACDDNETVTCAAFTEIYNEDAGPQGPTLYVGWRDAVGDEDGGTFNITTGGTEGSCAYVFRISGAADPTEDPPEASAEGTGSGVNPNALSLSPTGGSKDYLWISAAANDDDDDVTGYPSNMADNNQYSQETTVTLGIATEEATAASFDPAQFTIAASESWEAVTIAVYPYVAVTTYERTVLLDTLFQTKGTEKTVLLDTVLKKSGIPKTVLLDAAFQVKGTEKTVLLDTALQKTGIELTVLLDALLKAEGVERTVLLDTLLKKSGIELTVLLDAAFQELGIEKTVLLDAAFQKEYTATVLLDAMLQAVGVQRTVDLDALFKKSGIEKTVLLDAIFKYRVELTVLLDALFKAEGVERTVLLDTAFQLVGLQKTVLLDAAFQVKGTERTVLLDAAFQTKGTQRTTLLDTLFKKSGIQRTVLLDSYFGEASATYERTVLLDALFKKAGISRTVLLDTMLQKLGITRTVLLDSEFAHLRSIQLDTLFQAQGVQRTVLLDAYFGTVAKPTVHPGAMEMYRRPVLEPVAPVLERISVDAIVIIGVGQVLESVASLIIFGVHRASVGLRARIGNQWTADLSSVARIGNAWSNLLEADVEILSRSELRRRRLTAALLRLLNLKTRLISE